MRKLKERESKKGYIFVSKKSGVVLRKFSGDEISEEQVDEFEVPEILLEPVKEEKDLMGFDRPIKKPLRRARDDF